MMKIYHIVFLMLVVLLVTAFSGCTGYGPEYGPEEIEYFSSEYEAGNDTVLKVSNVNGHIEINSWEGDTVILDTTKRTRYGKDELDKVDITVIESDNEIKIETTFNAFEDARVSVDMDIKVPNNVTVDFVETTNGNIQIIGTKGDTTAAGTNGAIAIRNVDGYIKASTTNGAIDIRETTGIDDLETTNGKIDAQIFDLKDDVDIKCTNGGITLYINPLLNADIEAKTTNGDISVDDIALVLTGIEKTHMEAILGNGGNKIYITTTNGNVNLNELVV
ncbi:DUF4097 family beta strand repeat protein [Methanococcoides sp. SA1]|nr:DUF4097 family beta strand repeat protein [Methanococcoides sp. SA1]